MKVKITYLTFLSAICSLILLTVGFGLNGQFYAYVPIFFILLISLIAERYHWRMRPNLFLGLTFLMITIGMIVNQEDGIYLAAALFAFTAWDLRRFDLILDQSHEICHRGTIVRSHFQTLGFILLISVILGTLSLTIRLTLDFWTVVLLTVLAFGTLFITIRYAKSRGF